MSFLIDLLVAGNVIVGAFLLLEARKTQLLIRKVKERDIDAAADLSRWVEIQARWDQQSRATQLKRENEQKAALEREQFNTLIEEFPEGSRDVWGYSFSGWQQKLALLERQGLSLSGPSEDFSRLKNSVEASLIYNQDRAAQASNSALQQGVRASFSISSSVCLQENLACLRHLEFLESEWARLALENQTGPALGASRAMGRI